MPQIIDDVDFLAGEIGPRPAGTEEEQQAALYIGEQFKRRAGLETSVEDFSCLAQPDLLKYICFGVPFFVAILALFLPVMVLPAFLIALICAVLYGMELMGKPVLSKLLARGVSQNVVAKYSAGSEGGSRHRKVIVVANYDSGKARSELSGGLLNIYGLLRQVCTAALAVLAFFLLIRSVFFGYATGGTLTTINVIQIILMVLVALPVASALMHQFASYNDAAVSNASSVAVLMEVARRVGQGRVSNEELAARRAAAIHDEEEAYAQGVVPEGAQVSYEAEPTPQVTELDRLAAAKASIAALTGQPLREYAPATDIAANLAQVNQPRIQHPTDEQAARIHQEMRDALSTPEAVLDDEDNRQAQMQDMAERQQLDEQPHSDVAEQTDAPEVDVDAAPQQTDDVQAVEQQPAQTDQSASSGVPDWYKAAQEKATKLKEDENVEVKRSRYADALDKAVAESSRFFEEANRVAETSMEDKLRRLQQDIMDGTVGTEAAQAVADADGAEAVAAEENRSTVSAAAGMAKTASGSCESPSETIPMEPIQVQQIVAQTAPAGDVAPVQQEVEQQPVQQPAVEAEPVDEPVVDEVWSAGERVQILENEEVPAPAQPVVEEVWSAGERVLIPEDTKEAPEHEEEAFDNDVDDEYYDDDYDVDDKEEKGRSKFSGTARNFENKMRGLFHRKPKVEPGDEDPDDEYIPSSRTDGVGQADALDNQSMPGSTTAMPPIDVSALKNDTQSTYDDELDWDDEDISDSIDEIAEQEEEAPVQVPEHRPRKRAAQPARRRGKNRVLVDQEPLDADLPVEADYQDEFEAEFPEHDFSSIPAQEEPVVTEVDRKQAPRKRKPMDLPSLSGELTPVGDIAKQPAPLAEINEDGESARSSILNSAVLPRIIVDKDGNTVAEEPGMDNVVAARRGLRTTLPSMSGSISVQPMQADKPEVKNDAVSLTGSFAAVGSTGSIQPIGDELIADMDPDDIYIEDADDSAFDENVTQTGAFAGPGYMEMPKSRVAKLFGRFGRKKNETPVSTNEWLDVDDSFEARKVGAERGGWESFNEEDNFVDDFVDDFYEDEDEDGTWQGGAFSKLRDKISSGNEDYPVIDAADEEYLQDDFESEFDEEMNSRPARTRAAAAPGEAAQAKAAAPARERRSKSSEGSGRSARRTRRSEKTDRDAMASEMKQIHGFRNPDINLDVWFVALGSQLAENGGMKAFMAQHAADLRGAIVIDLESMGAGELCYIDNEGGLITKKPSSRMKRYVKKASQASGVQAGTAKITCEEGAAYTAMMAGSQAMTIAGMEGAKPAFYAQGDDTAEMVDPHTLMSNANFILELIKSI